MAVEYQLHGEWNWDIFRFQCHRETLEGVKLPSVLWGLCLKKMKNDVPGVLVTLIPGILSGWEILFILLHFLNPNKTEQNVPK